MLRVIIESPLGAPTRDGIEENKKYARLCVKHSLARGEAPYASHLFFDHSEILNDMIASERAMGMEAGFAWGEVGDLVAVYTDKGISKGMEHGIEKAIQRGQTVELRSIYTNITREWQDRRSTTEPAEGSISDRHSVIRGYGRRRASDAREEES